MEDKEIIHLYHQRNEIALSETASKYGKLLYSVAKGVLYSREDSEEIVNDTYQGAWTSMPPNKPDSLTAFLCRITRNLAISRYRKSTAKKREGVLLELTELEAEKSGMDDSLLLQELTDSINQFLEKLPREDRVIFVKRYFFDESLGELSEELLMEENKISSKLYRLRQKLKQKLIQEGYDL
ncbi:MAG: sigma-70 family RNA polymerase sigma factor [Eubacteriales bacterium]